MFEYTELVYIVDFTGKILYLSSREPGNKHNYEDLMDVIGYVSKTEFSESLEKIKNGENISFNILTDALTNSSEELLCVISPLYDYNGEIHLASVVITDRRYEFLFNENNDALFITDFDGNYLEVNSKASRRSGISHAKFKEISLLDVPGKQDSEVIKKYFERIIDKGSASQQIDYTNSAGKFVFTEVRGKKITYGGKSAILHSSREISEQRKSNQEILENVIQSEENDRKHYATEILDNLGPLLSLNKMLIETYFDTKANKVKNQIIEKINTNLEEAIKITTELTQIISPQILTKFGLRPALHTFITKFAELQKIKIRLILDIPEKFSEKIDTVIYRAIVEIVNYFTKYIATTFINIDLAIVGNMIKIILESNKEFINPNIQPDGNYQLKQINLESRLHSINGEIEYHKRKNIDRVIIKVPINNI
ncbi:MAG: PAS domain S-box protein [Bacteroidota bacterium]